MVLDTDAYEASGIETLRFPGGEWHCNVPTLDVKRVDIYAKLRIWDDIGKLLVVANAIQTQGIPIYLFCPYLPGARMDRNLGGNTENGALVYGRMLSDITMQVTAVDVHSGKAYVTYNTYTSLKTLDTSLWLSTLIKDKPDFILAPDKGAHDRAQAAATLFGVPVITADKHRDPTTGKLSGFNVPAHGSYTGARYLIVDDICDGGGTFVGIHEALLKVSPTAVVDLYVTHGLFSKGLAVLAAFNKIYTTDSFFQGGGFDYTDLFVEPLLPHYLRSVTPNT